MRLLMKHVLLLGGQGAAAPTEWVWTVTTTAPAQTVTLQRINPSAAITIDWGDGSSETIAAGNTSTKTHQYANAGAYTVTLPQSVYTEIDLRDAKIGMVITPQNPFPAVTSNVLLYILPNLTWEVTPTTPFPAVTGSVYLNGLPNLTWEVTPTTPFPAVTSYVNLSGIPNLTWEVTPTTPFPAVTGSVYLNGLPNLTWGSGAAANLHSVGAITYENNLLQADVDFVLADLYSVFAARTKAGTIDLLGLNNAAPSGTLQAACPPTEGKEYAYELVNDSCGVSAFHWTSVTIAS